MLPWQPISGKYAKLVTSSSFVALEFRNGLEYNNLDGVVNSGDDLATSCKNLVNFDPVAAEITMPICVQQASTSSRVNLATFAKRRHC